MYIAEVVEEGRHTWRSNGTAWAPMVCSLAMAQSDVMEFARPNFPEADRRPAGRVESWGRYRLSNRFSPTDALNTLGCMNAHIEITNCTVGFRVRTVDEHFGAVEHHDFSTLEDAQRFAESLVIRDPALDVVNRAAVSMS